MLARGAEPPGTPTISGCCLLSGFCRFACSVDEPPRNPHTPGTCLLTTFRARPAQDHYYELVSPLGGQTRDPISAGDWAAWNRTKAQHNGGAVVLPHESA